MRGKNVEFAVGLIALSLIESQQAAAATGDSRGFDPHRLDAQPSDQTQAPNDQVSQELHATLGKLADVDPSALQTLSIEQLKALLTPEALASLGLDKAFGKLLDHDPHAAIRKLEAAFRKKLVAAAQGHLNTASADHVAGDHDHLRAGDGEHHGLDLGILGGIPLIVPILGAAALGGIIAYAASKGGDDAPINHAPTAVNDTAVVNENGTVTFDVRTNDSDSDGDSLTVTQINGTNITTTTPVTLTSGQTTIGTVSLGTDGKLTFTPAQFFTGAPTFTYTVSDGHGGTATATVSLTVNQVLPTAVADTFVGTEDTNVTVDVLANDTKVTGATLAVTQVNGSAISTTTAVTIRNTANVVIGSAILDSTGKIVFRPAQDYNGAVSFTYTASDGHGGTATGTVTGTLAAVNDAPVNGVANATLAATAGISVVVPGLTVSDVDSTSLTTTVSVGHGLLTLGSVTGGATVVSGLGTGSLVLSGTPAQINASLAALTFTGTPGFAGSDTLTISTSDGALSDTDTVSLTLRVAQVVSGVLVDGYISGATIFIDVNGDGKYQAGEPTGTTDATGHFAIVNPGNLTGNIVAFGGVNTDTGLANTATFTAPQGSTVVNPLTTIVTSLMAQGVSQAAAQAMVAAKLGIPAGINLLTYDFLSTSNGTDAATSLAIQKAATQIATVLAQGVSGGASSDSISNAIATQFRQAGAVDLTSTATLTTVLTSAYTASNISTAGVAAAVNSTASINQAISTATSVAGLVNTVVELNKPDANLPPIAAADHLTVDEDHSGTFNILANDKDPEGGALTITKINGAAFQFDVPIQIGGGTITVSANGNVAFTPTADFNGTPSFTYTIADPAGNTQVGTATITVNAVNDAPVASPDTFATLEDKSVVIDVLSNDTDVEGDHLSITQVNGQLIDATHAVAVAGGSVILNADGKLVFTPAANFNGAPSFTYTVSDGHGGTATGTVSGTVSPVNDAPVATPDVFTTPEDTAVVIDVVGNDTDADGDKLSVIQIDGRPIDAAHPVTINGGTVSLNADGKLVFTPDANFNGNPTFSYTVSDGNGGVSTATVSGTVTAVNDAPVASNDLLPISADAAFHGTPVTLDVLANDVDVDGDHLTIVAIDGHAVSATQSVAVAGGTVILDASGKVVFTPAQGSLLGTTFSYTVSDGHGGTSTATATASLFIPNVVPEAVRDSFTTAEDAPVVIDVLANDIEHVAGSDFPSNLVGFTITQVNGQAISIDRSVQVAGGVVSLSDGKLVFTPNANFNGSPSFTYTITDPFGQASTGTVSGTVTAVNDAPVAVADSFTTLEDTSVVINVLANDSDVDGDTLTVTQVNGQAIDATHAVAIAGGSVILNADGKLVFTPTANFNGSPSFTYTVSDGHGGTATATVGGTVTPVNDAPVAVADSFTTLEDTSVVINVLANDSDVDGDTLTVTQVNGQAIDTTHAVAIAGGSVILNADGKLVFTPTANFNGSPSFTYTVSDGHGGTATATVSGTVTPVNDAPLAIADTATAITGRAVDINVLGNDSDVDGDHLTITQVGGQAISASNPVSVAGGTVALGADGHLIFTPTNGTLGQTSFNYTVSDGHGGTATSTVTVNTGVDGPVLTMGAGDLTTVLANAGALHAAGVTTLDVTGAGDISLTEAQAHALLDAGLTFATDDHVAVNIAAAGTHLTTSLKALADLHVDTVLLSGASSIVVDGTGFNLGSSDVPHFTTLTGAPVDVTLALPGGAIDPGTTIAAEALAAAGVHHIDFVGGLGEMSFAQAQAFVAAGISATQQSNLQLDLNRVQALQLAGDPTLATALHVDHLHVTDGSIILTDAQAAALLHAGLDFVTGDDVTVTNAGTHLSNTLKSLQDLHVDNVLISGGVLSIAAGEGFGDLATAALPHFSGVGGVDPSVTLDLVSGNIASAGDITAIVNNLHNAGIDHLDVAGNGPIELTYAQTGALSTAHIDFTSAADVTVDITAAQATSINPALLTALHIDHIDVTDSGTATITDAQAAALVAGGIDFHTEDNVVVTTQGTHLSTTLKGLHDLHVDTVLLSGAALTTEHVLAGEGFGDFANGGLPHFTGAGGIDPNVTLDLQSGNIVAAGDITTAAANLAVAGIDHLDVVGNGPVELSLAQANALGAAHIDFTTGSDVTLDITAAQANTLNATLLSTLHVDHIDVIGTGAAVISDVQAAALVAGGIDFHTEDNVVVTTQATHLSTTLKGLHDLHVDTVLLSGAAIGGEHVFAGEGIADIAAGGLPTFVGQLPGSMFVDPDVTLTLQSGNFSGVSASTMEAFSDALNAAHIDHLEVAGGGAISLNFEQISQLDNIDFTSASDVTLSLTATQLQGVLAEGQINNDIHIDHLAVSGAVDITDADAANLIQAGLDFTSNSDVQVTAQSSHLSTTLKGLQDLHVDTVMLGAAGSTLVVEAGTSNLAGLTQHDLPHFATDLDVTLDISANSLPSFTDLSRVIPALELAGIDHLGVSGSDELHLNVAQVHQLATYAIDFDPASRVTVDINPAELAGFANGPYDAAALNIHSINVGGADVSLTDIQATKLVESGLHFAASDGISVTAASTHMSTTLKGLQDLHVDTVAAGAGITSLHIDAGDLSTISSADLPHIDAALNVTLRVDATEISDVERLASALHTAGIDTIALNTPLSALSASDQAALSSALASNGLTLTYENFSVTDAAGTTNLTAIAAYQDVLHTLEAHADELGHGGTVALTDGALSSLSEAGLLRAYTAHTLVVDGTTSGDHLLTTLKDIADTGVDQVHLADQGANHPVYIDLGVSGGGSTALSEIQTLFNSLAGDGHGTPAGTAIFTGSDHGVALVVDAATANALSGSMDQLAKLGITEVDVLKPTGAAAPTLTSTQAVEVKIIGQDNPLYDHLHHGG